MRTCKRSVRGFAYVLLLVGVAVMSVAAAGSIALGAAFARRDAELQLLTIGVEFQNALRSYAGVSLAATLPGSARGPRTLAELLRDPRSPGIRRHLRQLYVDPLTGRDEWGLVKDEQGHILGVFSLAEGRPIRRTGFIAPLVGFDDAESYRQWVFGLPSSKPLGFTAQWRH